MVGGDENDPSSHVPFAYPRLIRRKLATKV